MQVKSSQGVIIFFSALFLLMIYLLSPILAPFCFAALLAYLMEPLVKLLEKKRFSHLWSVIVVFFTIFISLLFLVLMLVPLIQVQLTEFVTVVPNVIQWTQDHFIPWIQEFINISTLKSTLSDSVPKPTDIFNTILQSGYKVAMWSINLMLIPIVTFYFLRDWEYLCKKFEKTIPKTIRPSVVDIIKESDDILSAFFRGQFLVMLALSFIYGFGLMITGLQAGLMIGIIGGVLSIVPYLGSGFVLILSIIVGLVQFGADTHLVYVLSVFVIGQTIESYVLTPYLVGNRIGLHPVAVIFSVMAGGTLFGFFGVLVALPAAALIKVLFKYINVKYKIF